MTFDHNGINTGVFVVKRSDWSRAFLSLMYAQRVSVDYFNAKGKGSGFVDQQGLDILRDKLFSKEEFDSHTDVSARFTKFLNNYCSTGGLIHHRVDCNTKECDGHWSASFSIFVVETQLWTALHARHQNRCRACVVNR